MRPLFSSCDKPKGNAIPTSNLKLWYELLNLAWRTLPERICDVGPGLGKGGMLLREYVNRDLVVDAVEAEKRYVTSRLRAVYDKVTVADACDLPEEFWARYDLVWMVDVIEHMEKEDALALLKRIPGYVVVCTPQYWFQNPEAETFPFEQHRSLWTREDFSDRADVLDEKDGGFHVLLRPRDAHAGLAALRENWERVAKSPDARAATTVWHDRKGYLESGAMRAWLIETEALPADFPVLLELGCGDGRLTRHLARSYEKVYACDLAPSMLRRVRKLKAPNVTTVLSDGTDASVVLPEGLPSPRVVASDSVLMHNRKPDVLTIFREMRAVVETPARLVVQIPCYEDGPRHEPDNWTDVGIWTPREVEEVARRTRWRPLELAVSPGRFSWDNIGPRHADFHVFEAVE